ncbi:DUF1493 family protein [Chitinophaga caeni]
MSITGDDAEAFILQFGKRYHVDIGSFNFSKY